MPDEKIQELRSLMRTRKQLVREQTRHVQRIQKTLEEANIKLDSIIPRMIEAIIAGARNPYQLAAFADRGIKVSPKELYDPLHGRLTDLHRFLLQLYLGRWDVLDAAIQNVDQEVDGRIERKDDRGRTVAALSQADLAAVLDPRRQCAPGDDDPRRDRSRHEPLPDRRAPGRPKPKPGVWSPSSPRSASTCNSNRSHKPLDGPAKRHKRDARSPQSEPHVREVSC